VRDLTESSRTIFFFFAPKQFFFLLQNNFCFERNCCFLQLPATGQDVTS
jgi:hypothetical protein